MANSDRWLKSVPTPAANVSQSDVARIAREKREREEKVQLDALHNVPRQNIATTNIEPATENIPAPEFAPPIIPAPAVIIEAATKNAPPTEFTAPANRSSQPLQIEPAVHSVAPAKIKGAQVLPVDSPHLRTPHEITDKILPTLKPGCQVVLMRLYRLSAGFSSNTCHVSIPKLASSCNISETQIRIFLRNLEGRKLINRLSVDLSNKNQTERGITFEVLLPRLATAKSAPAMLSAAAANFTGGANSEPNKVNTQKENTQTQKAPSASEKLGVRVGSKFTIEECRKYAKHLQATGQGINNPGGYATAIHRTGEADLMIENFLNPIAPTQPLDISQCPDCQGSGFYYPKGINGGVTRCKHENLQEKPNNDV